MTWIDRVLNRITMYRLVLYILAAYLGYAVIISFFGLLPFNGFNLAVSVIFFVFASWLGNIIMSWFFRAPVHNDSAYLTALILSLIVNPIQHVEGFVILFWFVVLAISSKFILAIRGQHIFNPAALAAVIMGATLSNPASWWVGNAWMLPIVALGGFLILRKLKKFSLFFAFVLPTLLISFSAGLLKHTPLLTIIHAVVVVSPLVFFASVMLTEPVTMPGTKGWRLLYAAIIGVMFAPQFHLGSLYFSPELALIVGNGLSFLIQPRARYTLTFQKKIPVAEGIFDFVFKPDRPLRFYPGQYVEVMVPHPHHDGRGLRRYFTIASVPGETTIRFGVKFYPQPSTFKQALLNLRPGDVLTASQLGGDFLLPAHAQQPVTFIAGGIGVTPFRSMVGTLLAINQSRPITLLYSAQNAREIAYDDVFSEAERLGMKTVYTLTDEKSIPANWTGRRGFLSPATIQEEVPHFRQNMFYLSGPQGMVDHFKTVLRQMGVPAKQIKTDFFPGFA